MNYFINTPIRLADGTRFRKGGGVPSGSVFTNIIDSIVNCIVTRYVHFTTTDKLPLADIYLGDDSFVVSDGIVNLHNMANVAYDSFGMKIHPDKSYVTTNPLNIQFLGYFNRRGLPYKGDAYLVASFLFGPSTYRSWDSPR